MRHGQVIIGANYGDEGKGLMTDFFASQRHDDCVVVRFNGGAQAGHTVVAPDGRRHIYSHFGSGTFCGCATMLSKFFIVNPLLFVREREELLAQGLKPRLLVDPDAVVTTPIDMFVNEMAEWRRGAKKHGSCGAGINETITRNLRAQKYSLRVRDLLDERRLCQKLELLAGEWLRQRLQEHGEIALTDEAKNFVGKLDLIVDQFLCDVNVFLQNVSLAVECPSYSHVIFEGAQGLMLDEDRIDQWPHVTRSRTGLTNVLHLMPQFQLQELSVTYVTRTYLTRHGAGPLIGECDWQFSDRTNLPNRFQDQLRFAPLDWTAVQKSVEMDFNRARLSFAHLSGHLALTCADQLAPDKVPQFMPVSYISFGPTREDVQAQHCLTSPRALAAAR
jgi:adenylosuccinate synthase